MKYCLSFLFLISMIFQGYSQEAKKEKHLYLGLNYGQATQNTFPLDNRNYTYNNKYFKVQINKLLKQGRNFTYELNIEPSYYRVNHQLLNEDYISPDDNPNYLEEREIFTQERTFNEFALNFGIIMRYEIFNNFSSYVIGSVGPMISAAETERLKKGFAFSDIIGFGFTHRHQKLAFDLRLTFRHNSNANLAQPNAGHNSVGLETGVAFRLN